MTHRDLNAVAERIRTNVGISDSSGRVLRLPVDVERIAESRGLRIVGSEARGPYKLPARRSGQIRIGQRLLIVRAVLLDDPAREAELLEVLAHEIAHDELHAGILAQMPLPFGRIDSRRLTPAYLTFSSSSSDTFEREAMYLGALLLVPLNEMIATLSPIVNAYRSSCGQWDSTANADWAVRRYRQSAVSVLVEKFCVPSRVAKIALDYWRASSNPCREWVGN